MVFWPPVLNRLIYNFIQVSAKHSLNLSRVWSIGLLHMAYTVFSNPRLVTFDGV